MDNGYAARNVLNVRKMKYTGVNSAPVVNKHPVVKNASQKVSAPKTVSECAGVKEKYRMSARTTTMSSSGTLSSARNGERKEKGFVYVEHSGFAGTLKDAFCTKRVKTSEKSCFDKVVLVLVFAVLMFFVAGSYCEYYETFNESKEISSQIAEYREEKAKLLVAIEERNNKVGVEEYAVNKLGMVKEDKLTKHYINLSEKDTVTVTVNEQNESVSGGVLLSGFKDVLSNFVK